MCFLHMLPFHNVIFFHNHCTIDSTTMSIAYPQHIHTVLFTITQPSILYVLLPNFTYASCSQCDNYTLTLLFTYASFSQCDIFSQLLHNWHYNNVYSISLTYTYSTVYNYTTQQCHFAVYICFLFTIWYFFTITAQFFTIWYFFTITAQFTLQQCLQHILNIYIQYCLKYTN